MDEKESDNEHQETDTESECDFDPLEYEKIKEENLRKVVLTEHHYHQVRQLLRDRRYEEVRLKKQQLREQTCPEFLKKQKAILDEERRSRNESRAIFDLESHSLAITTGARREFVDTEQEDNYHVAKQSLIDAIEEILNEKIGMDLKLRRAIKSLACIDHEKPKKSPNLKMADSLEYNYEARKRAIVFEHDENPDTTIFTHAAAIESPCPSSSSPSPSPCLTPKIELEQTPTTSTGRFRITTS